MSELPGSIRSVTIEKPGRVAVHEEPTRALQTGEFFVKTLYSGMNTGTELTWYLGTNPKSVEGWDTERRLFRGSLEPGLRDIYPMVEGDMEVGEVVASKSDSVKVGDRLAMMYRHKSGHIAHESDRFFVLPSQLDAVLGIFVAHVGPVSMNGVLYAADETQRKPVKNIQGSLDGQRILVLGAGMIGILCGIFAKHAGAEEVIIVDAIPERLAAASKMGLTPMKAHSELPLDVKNHWRHDNPKLAGADIVMQCTGSDYLLAQAFAALRYQGTVVDLGFYQQGANQVFLGKEFHHNCLRHVCAQISGVPVHQTSWTKDTLSQEVLAFMLERGNDVKKHLLTHTFTFNEAPDVYKRLSERDHSLMQVVLVP